MTNPLIAGISYRIKVGRSRHRVGLRETGRGLPMLGACKRTLPMVLSFIEKQESLNLAKQLLPQGRRYTDKKIMLQFRHIQNTFKSQGLVVNLYS